MLSRNYSSADKRNGPQAVPKSSESSYIETFSLFLAFAMQMLFYTRLRTIILLGAVQGLDANKSVV